MARRAAQGEQAQTIAFRPSPAGGGTGQEKERPMFAAILIGLGLGVLLGGFLILTRPTGI
jgi:hypothetical protein